MNVLVKNPHDIEKESFAIIQKELTKFCFTKETLPVVTRVIHASADFDFASSLIFSHDAVLHGVDAIRQGVPIITDVNMVKIGIRSQAVQKFGSKIFCTIGDEKVKKIAVKEGVTRASVSIKILKNNIDGGIVVIGNSPTALFEVIRLVENERIFPKLIVGLPVGFVDAKESKDELLKYDNLTYITNKGRKGGTPAAVAVINALIIMALKEDGK